MKVVLQTPVAHGDKFVTELEIREKIVAGDLRGVAMRDPMFFDDLFMIAGRLAGQPRAVMEAIEWSDAQKVLEVVGGFFDKTIGPRTGPTPSQ